MDKVVSINRLRRGEQFILHPLGTFLGYGGYVGINPYRELPAQCDARSLGEAVVELLALSLSTGYDIDDINTYRQATTDVDTARIRNAFFSDIRSTADTVRRFLHAEVSVRSRSKSWSIVKFLAKRSKEMLVPEEEIKVRMSAGPEALGRALLNILALKRGGADEDR